ncbi:MAG: 2-amino-4-hydroxy-6-hydroxymethyldihydropteridine diphosphokinase [Syntrophobacterales bacterium CG_4_8_14_3_um_filter_58_8]|nr:MAG: 2-amino-4-hydroxy-6-hydroxymethyldihydropteridine diphosphokinase [Syntrophaceae bacterium CG2_30_58_14]PIV03393.1 MAG: 2-amino-4-hydroxy-6-hydroxymethyldihydropteridine diphosphokinase [Syntrophobacterales bacterium CG03_land_8_20_14_0_80_58_14]PJC74279.1 MAG: 2-amino-4-hydroxy-6-hydroxymethyldihydropteridine diphosphokinase [Syntrophobacterales bacterium CG_4_8_14_3_um_filter_58_8]
MGFQGSSGGAIRGIVAFIGIGANLGDPAAQCRDAVRRVGTTSGVSVLRCSSLYRTAPVGPLEQGWFINAVAEVRTDLSPTKLFEALKAIERQMGRTDGPRWGPRVIDLDILLYGQEVVDRKGLKIPHPEMHRRRFVLAPLCELASYVIHPAFGVSARGLLDRLTDPGVVDLYAPEETGE